MFQTTNQSNWNTDEYGLATNYSNYNLTSGQTNWFAPSTKCTILHHGAHAPCRVT